LTPRCRFPSRPQGSDDDPVDKNKCCTLCNMSFTSAVVAESHYQGKIHAKRLKLLLGEQPAVKPTANMPDYDRSPTPGGYQTVRGCLDEPLQAPSGLCHSAGDPVQAFPKGSQKLPLAFAETSLSSLKQPHADSSPVPPAPHQRRDSDRYCQLCAAWFNNPMMAQQHYDGKKHKKNAARADLLEQLGKTLDLGELRGKRRLLRHRGLEKPA
ncbi:Zinc finger matrin-type protein 4, partial [Varanus komodoensis]